MSEETSPELVALRKQLDRLQRDYEELRDAATPRERRDARDDVEDAQRAFEKAARRLGMDPDEIRTLTEKAREDKLDALVDAKVRAILAEQAGAAGDGDGDEDGDDGDEKDDDAGDEKDVGDKTKEWT